MTKLGGTKSWVAAVGIALLAGFVVVPALSGAASATTLPSATSAPSTQWAYGGEGWSNNSLLIGNASIGWDAMFGWTVVLTATPMGNGTLMLEEQRTVGITIGEKAFSPKGSLVFHSHAQEVDTAFANLTTRSTVYVGGQAVPALGILNASATVRAEIDQSISETLGGLTRSASFDATGVAQAAVAFAPSLGLVPLNLSGVSQWNSSAVATPSASWTISWNWADQGYNGTVGSGSSSKSGNLSGIASVNLTGYTVLPDHPFDDHVARLGVVLVIQGPFDSYDGFILVPHDFDLFGDAVHDFSSVELGSSAISAERLYVSLGSNGPEVSAADTTFGANNYGVGATALTSSGASPSVTSGPVATVQGQPMSVSQAHSEANGLTQTGNSPASSAMSGALVAGLVIAAIAVAVGAFGVVEWRAYARRRAQSRLVGSYSESWPNGVPHASALPSVPEGPTAPGNVPASVKDPGRRL